MSVSPQRYISPAVSVQTCVTFGSKGGKRVNISIVRYIINRSPLRRNESKAHGECGRIKYLSLWNTVDTSMNTSVCLLDFHQTRQLEASQKLAATDSPRLPEEHVRHAANHKPPTSRGEVDCPPTKWKRGALHHRHAPCHRGCHGLEVSHRDIP